MTTSQITAFALEGADGVRITAYRAMPAGPAKGLVQIAHGMAEHSWRYRRLIGRLTEAGYGVYAADHRGHGASAAAHGLGDFGPGGFQSLVDDMAALTKVAKAENPGLPLALLGHSMGSFAAQIFLLEHHGELAALALSGTAAVDKLLESMAASGAAPGTNLLNAPFEPARTASDWLSRDEAEVDAYIADPLCGFELTPAASASIFALAAGARHDPRLAKVRRDLPVHVISGEFDPVTGPGQAFALAVIDSWRAAGIASIDHHVYPGGRHEMFNELGREKVEDDLIGWLDSALSLPG